ncbi:MAG TPA: helix-turn-helix domain-containing protein [Oceanipulchritudo sp.]|nr:helix-turn-helix domain-containing protein [Oceanipulchritudo sp.]
MDPLPAQPNRSLMEGLEVLLALAQRGEAVGVRELARELGMTPTRVQRYLATLAHAGLTERTPQRRYGVGAGIHALSAMSLSASGLAGRAMQVLPPLGDLGLKVALGVLWRDTVNYLYFSLPGMPVSEMLGHDRGFPARRSSIGMLLLAEHDASHVGRFFGKEAGLTEALEKVRTAGYARVEQPDGETSLAVAVGNPPVAGLALSGIIREAELESHLKRLREAATQLAATSRKKETL